MASPQEVLEAAIPFPDDATHSSKRAAAQRVIQALAVNDYYFVRRRVPVLERDDGQCPTCKTELVHIDTGPIFADAESRIFAMSQRIRKMQEALDQIANGSSNAPELAKRALYG